MVFLSYLLNLHNAILNVDKKVTSINFYLLCVRRFNFEKSLTRVFTSHVCLASIFFFNQQRKVYQPITEVVLHTIGLAAKKIKFWKKYTYVDIVICVVWGQESPCSFPFMPNWAASWQNQQNDCAPSEDSDQPGHVLGLIRVFAVRSMDS